MVEWTGGSFHINHIDRMWWQFIHQQGRRNLWASLLRCQLITVWPWLQAMGTFEIGSLESKLPLSSIWIILLKAHAPVHFNSKKKADCVKYLDIRLAMQRSGPIQCGLPLQDDLFSVEMQLQDSTKQSNIKIKWFFGSSVSSGCKRLWVWPSPGQQMSGGRRPPPPIWK